MSSDDPRERDSVLRDLTSDDDEVRRLAVERSAALAQSEVVPQLIERLGDESWRVRKAAVERLAAWRDGQAVAEALIDALADGENPGRRNAAVDALTRCGPTVLPSLIEALPGGDPDVRKFIVDVLAGIGDPHATAALIERLADEDTNVRAAAADGLGAIGGQEAIAALVATATSEEQDALVRFSALHALAALGVGVSAERLSDALEQPVLRPAALEVLGRIEGDAGALEVLTKALESRARTEREAAMRSLLRCLSQLEPAGAEALAQQVREVAARCPALVVSAIERLGEADLSTRLMLLQFLGIAVVPDAVVPMLLAGADEALEQVAIGALAAMGSVAEDAIDEVWSDLGSDARRDACSFFAHAGGERSATRLVAALDDPDPLVRTAAARSLAVRGVAGALAPLIARLRHASGDELETGEERAAVADALIALGRWGSAQATARARASLVEALDGATESVRAAIARVLGHVGRPEDGDVVSLLIKDESPQVRCVAVEALVRLEPTTSAESLHLAIGDESTDVRIAAAEALGRLSSAEAFPDLCRLAEDPDPAVRAAAVRSVGAIPAERLEEQRTRASQLMESACGDVALVALAAAEAAVAMGDFLDAIVALLQRSEPEVVREAVRCLGQQGSLEQLDAVVPHCGHPDWSVRAEAIQVLADRGATRAVPAILRRLDLEQDPFVRDVTLRALERLEA